MNTGRQQLTEELIRLVTMRLLWIALPARQFLLAEEQSGLAEMIALGVSSTRSDLEGILGRFEVRTLGEIE